MAMRRALATYIAMLMVGCYNNTDTPMLNAELPAANTTIAQLRDNTSQLETSVIEHDIVVRGRVTSSDKSGNFYQTIVIEDNTAALELLVGGYSLESKYPEGLLVALRLEGCATEYRHGVLCVGSKADSYDSYGVDYLASRERIDEVIVRSLGVEPITPARRTIAQLESAECGRLTTIESLHLIGSTSIDTLRGETLDIARWSGYSMFVDTHCDTLVVYTSEYADYSEHHIPNGELSLTGILQHGKHPNNREYYQLKMRYEEDAYVY